MVNTIVKDIKEPISHTIYWRFMVLFLWQSTLEANLYFPLKSDFSGG